MQISIRFAGLEDLDTIVEFNRKLALETEQKNLSEQLVRRGVRSVLDDPGKGRYLLAEIQGQVVGQLMHTFEWSDWRCAMFWWLQSVYIKAEFRRRGVFSRLLATLRDLAEAQDDVCGLRLYVEDDNAAAQATYRAMGMPDAHYRVCEVVFSDLA